MYAKTFIATATLAVVSASLAAVPAQARLRGGAVSVQGSGGRGFMASRSIDREPGSVSANRSVQTNSGRGITSSRSGSWSDGSYSGGATHTLNNGDTFGRTTTATNNGDGTGSYSTTRTGIDGQSTTVSGTVSHTPQ